MVPVDGKMILSDGTFPVGAGAKATFSAVLETRRPFAARRLVIIDGVGWLVKSLRFQHWEQLADAGTACPAEMFAPEASFDLVFPILRGFERVEIDMINSSTEKRCAPVIELHGDLLGKAP